MNILSISFQINTGDFISTPVYECHSWEKAEEIIKATQDLLKDKPNATFSFEVFGNSTAHIA